MPTLSPPSIELPAGYALLDRLGAGGYGEVWKATAPGGVEKAVKIVFGHCDEELAEREFKAMDRVRTVRHPFLLSIERYEIVNHRLVIVSELADTSLDARFKTCQEEGLSGVPRKELLGYLSDTAEALDWLSERHDLQHLDIKPENLLIVGDHIKVADFGLVKDIATQTLNSMVGGMTPIYSAPEIYDDNPSHHSDQYSLAIVFQQMLTGVLPFPGRTPAQLAKQHTQSQPLLSPLSEADQEVVGKALSKQPETRFQSCRDFIEALKTGLPRRQSTSDSIPSQPQSAHPELPREEDTKTVGSLNTEPVAKPKKPPRPTAQPAKKAVGSRPGEKTGQTLPKVSAEIVDINMTLPSGELVQAAAPTLFLAAGGVGISMMASVKQQWEAAAQSDKACPQAEWLAIDTDPETIKNFLAGGDFATDDLLLAPLRRPKQYRDDSQKLLKWLSRRWLYNIPRSLLTRGYRPLGRLALVDHAESVVRAIHQRVSQLTAACQNDRRLRIVIFAGASGGTGSGTFIDLAQAARTVSENSELALHVQGVLACTVRSDSNDSLSAVNMGSLLTELSHTQQHGNRGESPLSGFGGCFERAAPAFDELRLVTLPGRHERKAALSDLSEQLVLESHTSLGSVLAQVGASHEDASTPSGFTACHLVDVRRATDSINAQQLSNLKQQFACFCLAPSDRGNDRAAQIFGDRASAQFASEYLRHSAPQLASGSAAADPEEEGASDIASQENTEWDLNASKFLGRQAEIAEQTDNAGAIGDAAALAPHLAAEFEGLLHDLCRDLAHGDALLSTAGRMLEERLAAACQQDDEQSLSNQAVDILVGDATAREHLPLNCGCRRRTLLVSPQETQDDAVLDAIAAARPSAERIQAGVSTDYLLSLYDGISPTQLASRLAESYPDLLEAANRVHAREDIAWAGLG